MCSLLKASTKFTPQRYALREGRGFFADALFAALGAKAGCSATFTFDRKALKVPGLELLSVP
jgi:predicted nucleic-acid-binding protein